MTSTIRQGHYDPDNPDAPETAPDRHAAMVGATSSLRPARSGRFPLESVLVTVGAICVPVGVILIIVGWYGVAHTGFVFQQNAYLISGGMLGLGLIFIGGFAYFAYWMTRQLRASDSNTQQMLRALSRLESQMASVAASTAASAFAAANGKGGALAAGTPGVRRATGSAASAPLTPPVPLVATERGSLLHRPDCPTVVNKEHLRQVAPDTPGYRPCLVCNPLDEA